MTLKMNRIKTSEINVTDSESTREYTPERMPAHTRRFDSSNLTIKHLWKNRKAWLIYKLQLLQFQDEVKKERRALRSLSDSMLRDIGVSRGEADMESRRDFDDLPMDRLDAPRMRD